MHRGGCTGGPLCCPVFVCVTRTERRHAFEIAFQTESGLRDRAPRMDRRPAREAKEHRLGSISSVRSGQPGTVVLLNNVLFPGLQYIFKTVGKVWPGFNHARLNVQILDLSK